MNNTDKIKEAKLIQRMIVDNGDADEINARVLCLSTGSMFQGAVLNNPNVFGFMNEEDGDLNFLRFRDPNEYTKSLDACQSLMLEGWWFDLIQCGDGVFKAGVYKPNYDPQYYHRGESAPEAWLYSILESYIYEWSNEDD